MSIYDFKPLEFDEKLKSLVVSGESWEFNQSKRLLSNIAEIVLTNMNKDVITCKFATSILINCNNNVLKVLSLVENQIETLKDVFYYI